MGISFLWTIYSKFIKNC